MSVDDAVTLVSVDQGAVERHVATVVSHDQTRLRVTTAAPVSLAVGGLVGVVAHTDGRVRLALVADTVGAGVTELRILERRD